MKKLLFIPLALFIAVNFSACKKADPDPTPTPSKEELLAGSTSKSWQVTKLMISGNDFTPLIDECDKDDLHVFYRDMRVETLEGATKCDPDDPQLKETGTWSFNNDKSKLTRIEDGETMVMDINELSNSALRVTGMEDSMSVEITFMAK